MSFTENTLRSVDSLLARSKVYLSVPWILQLMSEYQHQAKYLRSSRELLQAGMLRDFAPINPPRPEFEFQMQQVRKAFEEAGHA